jgi:ABC-2 type transport system permease protein
VLALWYLPLFSWLLFSSAFVRKTPFMLALGLPLALIVAEKWVLGSHQLFRVLRDQIGAGLYNFGVLVQDPAALPHRITDALSASQFLLGLLVSAVFLSACVWLRNNRWEI